VSIILACQYLIVYCTTVALYHQIYLEVTISYKFYTIRFKNQIRLKSDSIFIHF
jgi:hypothetical protein